MSIADAYRRQTVASLENVSLPSGAVFRLRRVPMASWIATGKIDGDLVGRITSTSGRLTGLSSEDIAAALRFLREALLFACVEPRLTVEDRELQDDELHMNELAAGDFEALAAWIVQNGKIAPVGNAVMTRRQKKPGTIPFSR